ncbi:Protein YeeZ [Halomonadaceae bacterium LMG 33818]|uniref:SDR family oxidoreductase n=1 Tax=Cernens ardua TaxID=3402176 RepID=UPI003EDC4F39
MNSSILIVGCGYVGTELGIRLVNQGHRVWGARRSPQGLPDSIEPVALDITDPVSLLSLPDVDVLVYAISADKFDESAYQTAYVDGLNTVLSHYEQRAHSPRHVFFVSSTAVYNQSEGEIVDEDSPTEPTSFSGALMLQAEQRLLNSSLQGSVLRLSGIYGPGRERLINQVEEGHVAPPDPEVLTNRIHRNDAAGTLAFLIQRVLSGASLAPVYLGTDCDPASLHEVTQWLADRLGVTPQATMERSARRRSNKRCSNARLLSEGYRFQFPDFKAGYEQVLEERASSTR